MFAVEQGAIGVQDPLGLCPVVLRRVGLDEGALGALPQRLGRAGGPRYADGVGVSALL
jgi:hypothetical protein